VVKLKVTLTYFVKCKSCVTLLRASLISRINRNKWFTLVLYLRFVRFLFELFIHLSSLKIVEVVII